jgi:uncharacterized protein YycO
MPAMRKSCRSLLLLLGIAVFTFGAMLTPAGAQTRTIDSWLEFKFASDAPMGDSRNPAVILPSALANLVGNVPGAKRSGDTVFIPAIEFQKIANQPLASLALGPLLNQITNVKSFDGFNAVDLTGLIKNLPSEIVEVPDAAARQANPQNADEIKGILRDGDIVFGSHVINYMTWGRFNHVALVVDAAHGILAESTAELPTDMPGVRVVEWSKFASGYAHVGVVRLKGKTANDLPRVVSWVSERKGKPYRWPIIQGLDKSDQSRFYCSQLVWLAFKNVLNLDLDADKGLIVFPDDIYYSKEFVDVIVP